MPKTGVARLQWAGLLVKVPLGSSRRVAGRPHSAANPLSITSTISQSIIVCNLHTNTIVDVHPQTQYHHAESRPLLGRSTL